MYRIWAVARHMIAESIRQKIALVGIVLAGAMLAILPFATEGDGATLTSRVQSFLAYTLGSTSFILSIVTVFLACLAISEEITNKRIFMIVTKPLPRWQFFVGKWLGIGVLNAALLLLCLVSILVATWFLKDLRTTVPGDRERLKYEVLSARFGIPLSTPDFTPQVEESLRRMREEGRFEQVTNEGMKAATEQVRNDLAKSWRSIPPGKIRRFEFSNHMLDRKAEGFLHLRIKPVHAGGMSNVDFPATIQFGDVDQPETLTRQAPGQYLADSFHSIPVPYSAVNSKGTLYVMIRNEDPQYTYSFEGNDSLELMFDIGTFHWNLFRALTLIWCRLAFLAAVGLLMSSFLSFPVACMGAFLVLIVSSSAGFLGQSVDWVAPVDSPSARDPLWIIGPMLRPIALGFIWLVPDFSQFDPDGNVVNGRLVPLMWVIQTVIELILVKGLIVMAIGCLVLSRRELAQETS